MLVFEESGKPEYPEKNLSEKGENQPQTQPTNDAGSGNRTRATLVGEGGRGWEEYRSTRRKTSRSKERTNNKLNPHMTPGPGIKPGPHWWGRGGGGDGRKTGVPGEKPLGARREPTTNSTHIWRRVRESNPGHTGGEGGRGWEEDRSTRRKTSRSKERTNNKLNPHMTPGPGIEPGPHWWEASALTTAPTLLPWYGYDLWNNIFSFLGCNR